MQKFASVQEIGLDIGSGIGPGNRQSVQESVQERAALPQPNDSGAESSRIATINERARSTFRGDHGKRPSSDK
jgi:hypothetical protein